LIVASLTESDMRALLLKVGLNPVAANALERSFAELDLGFVWRVTNEVRDWPRLFTEYASAEVTEQEPGRIVFRLTTRPDEDGKVYSWVSERRPDSVTHTVRARRIETEPQPGDPVPGEGTQWSTGAGRSGSEPVATLAGEG
jgi:hypothetical protein